MFWPQAIKMTQSVDDTSLPFDGSQSSLQTALNTLEISGSLLGLNMNIKKIKFYG